MTAAPQVLKSVSCRDLRATLAGLHQDGWDLSRTSGGHIRLMHKDAQRPVFSASTPSDYRGQKNLVAECAAVLRKGAGGDQKCGTFIPASAMTSAPAIGAIDIKGQASLRRKNKERWSDDEKENRVKKSLSSALQDVEIDALPPVSPAEPAINEEAILTADLKSSAIVPAEASVIDLAAHTPRKPAPAHEVAAAPAVTPSSVAPEELFGASARQVTSMAEIFELAKKVVLGQLRELTITPEMVGMKLLHSEQLLVLAAEGQPEITPAPVSIPQPAAALSHASEPGRPRGAGLLAYEARVRAVLGEFRTDWISRADLMQLAEVSKDYPIPGSAQSTTTRLMARLEQQGVVEARQAGGKGGTFEYRMK